MSYRAIRWAFSQAVEKSSAKFVLVAMADCINAEAGDMLCWPSYAHLAAMTGQDAKTVEAGLRRLRESGLITDTGERKGTTGKVVVYRLNTPKNGGDETDRNTPEIPVKTPVSGAVAPVGNTPVFPANTPVFPPQYPQISRSIPPKTGGGIGKEQGKEQGRNRDGDARLRAIPAQTLADYLKVRKAKRAGEFTATAIDGMEREAVKVGLSLEDAIRACAEFGWQGFNAGWYLDRTQGRRPAAQQSQPPRRTTAVDRQIATINALTGRSTTDAARPRSPGPTDDIIDADARPVA